MNIMILLPIVLPVIVGFVLLFLPERVFKSRQSLLNVTGVSFIVCALLALYVISGAAGDRLVLFDLVGSIPVYFAIDSLGRLFEGIVVLIFLMAGFFSFVYMAHEKNEKRYYSFYLITFGVLMGLDFSPIKGPEVNIEYLAWLKKGSYETQLPNPEDIVDASHCVL